tara:strand:+ start:205 stop:864 length:660 start_codon:yes stop_codon:yes gene_type:complete
VNKFPIYFLLVLTIYPILGCQKSYNLTTQIDNKSYINDFELLQENPNNETRVKITSPKAIIDPTNNDIEILESSIEILNKNGQDFLVESGNSTLNNSSNVIRVFNNVNISSLENEENIISTNSFVWDLNTSVLDLNNPLNINLDNSMMIATNGLYNINLSLLKIDNTEFIRKIYNSEGKVKYRVEIKSDFAKWFKKEKTLVFRSKNKQVETNIKFLLTK